MTFFRRIAARASKNHVLGEVAWAQRFILSVLILTSVMLSVTALTLPSGSNSPIILGIAFGLLVASCWRWIAWIRGAQCHLIDIGLETLTIITIAIALGDPLPVLGIVHTSFFYRPFFSSSRLAIAGGFMAIVGFYAGAFVVNHPTYSVTSASVAGQAPMLVLVALLGFIMAYTFKKQRALTDELSNAEARYRSLIEQLPEVVLTRSTDGVVTYMSPQADRVLGYAADRIVGMTTTAFADRVHPADRTRLHASHNAMRHSTEPFMLEYRFATEDGKYRWLQDQGRAIAGPDGSISHWLGTLSDISERKQLEDQIAFQAFHDNLTSLPNRSLLRDRLEHAIARSERTDQPLAVLFLDLDNFKIVNDSLGHNAGDELIQAVAKRLQKVVRNADTVARIGGDEFVILLEDLSDEAEAIETAERLLRALSAELLLKGQALNISASIGVACETGARANADDMIRHADLAMYAAKRQGRSGYQVYSPEMGTEAIERLEIETGLRRALDQDQLVVHFQPVVDLRTGKITEMEGLVRWQHPKRGLLLPAAFLDVAEETGMIRAIDLWVLRESCIQVRAWQQAWPHLENLIASVNLSPSQLREVKLSEQVAAVLEETGLQPRHLKLEITERAMVQDVRQAREALVQLAALGVKLALDDFGTGNSALNYLREFPIDTLKIDRSFVTGMSQGAGDVDMVQALITLAQSLGLDVTAEGIEGDEYRDLLRYGCDHGQGYHFARPQHASVLEYIVRQPTLNIGAYEETVTAAG